MSNKNKDGTRFVKILTVEECGGHWTKYKKIVNEH